MVKMSDNGKYSFVVYDEWATMLYELPDLQAGQLIRQMCAWKLGAEAQPCDPTIKAVFSGIQTQMIKDAEKWEETKRKRSEAGRAGAEARWKR